VPVFPLAIIYAILSFILFSSLYMTAMFIKVRGIIGYVGIIIFSVFILIFEMFNGKFDYFRVEIGMNFTQICAILLIGF
jgi:hypothetical protein